MGNLCSKKDPRPVRPNPATVRPNPVIVTPNPATVRSNSVIVRPNPVIVTPNPATVRPNPVIVTPNLATVRSNPVIVRPNPATVKSNPVIARPNPATVKSNPVIARPNPATVRSNPVIVRPNPVISRRDPVFVKPNHVTARPNPVTTRPGPVVVKPVSVTARSNATPKRLFVRSNPSIVTPKRTLVTLDPQLIIKCLEALPTDRLCREMITEYRQNPNSMYPKTRELEEWSSEFLDIKNLFSRTNKKYFLIDSIEKIYNPFTLIQYEMKKRYLQTKFTRVEEKFVFHGTKNSNVKSIINNNFNWRLHGTSTGHQLGEGVCFTPICNYATHYGDKNGVRAMFLVKMLVSNSTTGNEGTVIPPKGYDTTHKYNRHVYVKYDDDTFCPTHVIYYYDDEDYENDDDEYDDDDFD